MTKIDLHQPHTITIDDIDELTKNSSGNSPKTGLIEIISAVGGITAGYFLATHIPETTDYVRDTINNWSPETIKRIGTIGYGVIKEASVLGTALITGMLSMGAAVSGGNRLIHSVSEYRIKENYKNIIIRDEEQQNESI